MIAAAKLAAATVGYGFHHFKEKPPSLEKKPSLLHESNKIEDKNRLAFKNLDVNDLTDNSYKAESMRQQKLRLFPWKNKIIYSMKNIT